MQEMQENWKYFDAKIDNDRMLQFDLFQRIHDLQEELANAWAQNRTVAFESIHKLYKPY